MQQQSDNTAEVDVTGHPANTQIEMDGESTLSTQVPQQEEPQQQEEQQGQQSSENPVEQRKAVEEDLKNDLASRGVDFDKVSEEFSNTGTLSEATLAELDKAGYPKSVVDNYIKGMYADAERFANAIISSAGGEENFERIKSYVLSTYDEAQIESLNRTIMSGDINQISFVIRGLQAEMNQTNGSFGRAVIGGSGANSQESDGFQSKQEMTEAMSDPRYGRDRAYTLSVERKVRNASFF